MSSDPHRSRSPDRSAGRRLLGGVLQLGRVAIFVAIIGLIHSAQQHDAAGLPAENASLSVDPQRLHQWYGPQARAAAEQGRVVDETGAIAGRLLQTSPASDDVIGFSGPTNLLLAFDAEGRLLGTQVLSSGDTREHVEQVRRDAAFFPSLLGQSADELARGRGVDAVSGATLTSLAMLEGIQKRLGGGLGSLKFPDEPSIEDVRPLFPDVTRMEQSPQDPAWWTLFAADDQPRGGLLRTVPAADNVIGYQGPTETLIGFDTQDVIVGFVVGGSYDNQPYVDYVREDDWYRNSFNDKSLQDLAALNLDQAGVEGVSGATMTSLAVAEGMQLAAAAYQQKQQSAAAETSLSTSLLGQIPPRNWGTIAVTLAGIVIGLTSLRGRRWVRVPFQCLLIGYLGFVNGDLVSQALLVGWAQHGVAWRSMLGVFVLSAAAFLVPVLTRHNVYCHQLCPHGALQQWLRPGPSRRLHLPGWLRRLLSLIPGGLLLLVVAVGMGAVKMSLVDIEPFDAYLVTIAGTATISIALIGLVAAAFVPMAYCRYGCPTGAAIEYVRRHARSNRVTPRDAVAVGCLLLALWLF